MDPHQQETVEALETSTDQNPHRICGSKSRSRSNEIDQNLRI